MGNNKDYLVYGGEESDAVPPLVEGAFSPAGARFLAVGQGVVSLDGKVLRLANVNPAGTQASAVGFSTDGFHFAFLLRDRGTTTLYLDGVAQIAPPGFVVEPNYTWIAGTDARRPSKVKI